MKLMYCQNCGDIVPPDSDARQVRWCRCGRHAVWWENPSAGILRLHDRYEWRDMQANKRPYPRVPRAYVLGITNALLEFDGLLDAVGYQHVIDKHPMTYLFRQHRSCIVRFRPGESSDTAWAGLPGVDDAGTDPAETSARAG